MARAHLTCRGGFALAFHSAILAREPRAVHGTMVLCVENALNRGGLARAVAL